ncbi:MAG: ADP-ribosylglycohydrolase family protein [Synergistaceae bacterium]|nr:ADP-ribosylglycohydrolase family protein [Synergistaceae bacterium]
MLGAIAGDIIGSPYEFKRNNIKTTEFPLFSARSRFTDDTLMTCATAWAFIETVPKRGEVPDKKAFAETYINCMHELGHAYPFVGFGGKFVRWLLHKSREPYGSFGNGSAMRVSPVAWAFDDLETVEIFAGITAMVTHNHPEGIKGAQATASAIFLGRSGNSKEQIRDFITERYGYDLTRTLDEIRPGYEFDATCQGSVPEAITAFLEGESYEDTVRKAVSIGGDSDTIACIAGAIAEGFYGSVPKDIAHEALSRLDDNICHILSEWYTWMGGEK